MPSIFFESDVMVPISSHWFRQLWRGRPHIPIMFGPLLSHCEHVQPRLLRRVRYSVSSFKLSKMDRQQVLPRFNWRGGGGIRSVTLVDDICTTGSTVTEIARLLNRHGIKFVRVLVGAYVCLD